MTKEFVAIPFKPVNPTSEDITQRNDSWTAVTRVYQTSVDCVPVTTIEAGRSGDPARYTFTFTTDGCSCISDLLPVGVAARNLIYTPCCYDDSGTAKLIFLGVWAKSQLPASRSTDIDVAGIFCRPRYSYADVDLTVDATELGITRFSFIEEPTPLTAEDRIIDIDTFEQYIQTGIIDYSLRTKTVRPFTNIRYKDWHLIGSTMSVGYAIGLENKTFDDFRDPKIFGDAVNKTHKLLFNYAVRTLFRDEDQPQQANGTRMSWEDGVVVVPAVAHLLAVFLTAVALCLAGVFFLSYNRHNNLHSDPDALATKMSLVAQSPRLLKDFEGADNCPDIDGCIKRRRYKLWGGEDQRLDIVDGSVATLFGDSHESSTKPHDGQGIRPWELGAWAGVAITTFTAGLLALLVVLYWSSQKYSGKRPPRSLPQY